jgi:hypothetical protein
MQRGEIAGARNADHRADEHGEPEPGLTEHPLRPAVLLLLLLRRPARGQDWYLAPAVQPARREQAAGGEEQQADGQPPAADDTRLQHGTGGADDQRRDPPLEIHPMYIPRTGKISFSSLPSPARHLPQHGSSGDTRR